jgi:hypothetical protein
MQITANHKKPGDTTPCTACSRVRTETYVLTLGNVTVCVCDQCWPRMLERVATLGVQSPDDGRDGIIRDLEVRIETLEDQSRMDRSYLSRLEDDRHTLEGQNTRLREEIRQLTGANA